MGRPSFATSGADGFGTAFAGVVLVLTAFDRTLVMTGGFAFGDAVDALLACEATVVGLAAGSLDTTGGAAGCFGLSASMPPPPTMAMSATRAKIRTGRLIVRSTIPLSALEVCPFTAQLA